MNCLSSERVLQENQGRSRDSITSLMLHHKALSDVSCLSDFKNLERLDLGFNNLSSLEGLRACINLKWLSVLQNKLQSLKGIESFSKLTVLNAGKNKLTSMDEVKFLTSLRALILNDNEISSICMLDQLKDLNTLVLSRNPILNIGNSLVKSKSITKLSLSNCQIRSIGSSLVSCVDLKEVRLAHNEIMTLPHELAHNVKLQNLDVGNNLITSWSDLKGNPIAEKEKLAKKIKKYVPNLQIFNARPMERSSRKEKVSKKDIKDHETDDSHVKSALDLEEKHEVKIENPRVSKKISRSTKDADDVEIEVKQKKWKRTEELSKRNASVHDKDDVTAVDKKEKRKQKKAEKNELDIIDDGETPFMEIISSETAKNLKDGNRKDHESIQDIKSVGGLVTFPAKIKKARKKLGAGHSALQLLSPGMEIGMGGQSMWDA
ncbi:PREDICTED: uncharacterized protein LOC104589379 isoform X2 [Nelumbo nucifera]|uniref:Uncharacterized protein LOC104589379 isoform X2 n=1 Tax=Nelumbo nucifera TaxID=4432 RepID=A0A1U7YZB4_NELNU|nr:PREDICTED: uncharacterized protein LOC104589379 isoform X2 [Nelumbo nucifera]